MANILGVSASLRSARFGAGARALVEKLNTLPDEKSLIQYIALQTKLLLSEFFENGRIEGKPFDELLIKLRKAKGDRGLSNSEGSLTAALWGAQQFGANIRYLSLANHFPLNGLPPVNVETIREAVQWADGILLSGPVYFGDRGSLAESFLQFIHEDYLCREAVVGKVYAGVSVGAKRNGGQETNLIYQLVDATNLNMLGVGNDSRTTAQYGGTAVAGDVGEVQNDAYGIRTSISTGGRIASIARTMELGCGKKLKNDVRIGVWLLQDDVKRTGKDYFEEIIALVNRQVSGVSFELIEIENAYIHRCIACDICPVSVGPVDEYRCIIMQKDDFFMKFHKAIIGVDAFLLAAYSPRDRSNINSVYQKFIERTRYLRRDDYVFGDCLTSPFVISEVGANQNLHIRMMTSSIRHLTVLHHPLIGFEYEGKLLNQDDIVKQCVSFVKTTKVLTAGRLAMNKAASDNRYNPVGYIVSREKQAFDQGKIKEVDALKDLASKKSRLNRIE